MMYHPGRKMVAWSVQWVSSYVQREQREQLEILLQKYQDMFKSKPGKASAIKHFIYTDDSRPVKQRPYRLTHAYWEEVKQELREMLAEGVIEPSQSDCVSPVVLVKKKSGAIDYMKLNAQNTTDAYPIPRIEDILDQVGIAKFIYYFRTRLWILTGTSS